MSTPHASLRPVKELFENIHQPVLITNELDNLIYANPAALQLLNATSIDIKNVPLKNFLTASYKKEESKGIANLKKIDDDKTILVEAIESLAEYEGKIHKIILLKEIQTQYQSSEEKIRLLLKTIHKDIARREEEIDKLSAEIEARTKILNTAAIVSETDQYGTITFANDTFCRIAKYSREELIGKPHNIVRHPDMPKAVFKEMWDTIKAGKIFQGIVKNRAKDGTPYWVIATIGGVLDSEGKPYKYIGVRIDITDLIKNGMKVEQYLAP